jgi:hypothetical protein
VLDRFKGGFKRLVEIEPDPMLGRKSHYTWHLSVAIHQSPSTAQFEIIQKCVLKDHSATRYISFSSMRLDRRERRTRGALDQNDYAHPLSP